MPILYDAQGHPTAAANRENVFRLDEAVDAYLGARADARDLVRGVADDDPQCVMAHCLDGYLSMLSSKRDTMHAAVECRVRAADAARRGATSRREMLHVAAL